MALLVATRVRADALDQIDSPLTDDRFPYKDELRKDPHNFIISKLREFKLTPEFPLAKYVSVFKFEENEKYILKGNARCKRNYSVGVMTEDNHFYFNKFSTASSALSRKAIPLLYNVFLRGYNYDTSTYTLFNTKVYNYFEPVEILFSVISGVTGSCIYRGDVVKRCAYVNSVYRCIPEIKRISDFTHRRVKDCFRALYEMGAFVFAEKYPEIMDILREYVYSKDRYLRMYHGELETIIGILYLQCKRIRGIKRNRKIEFGFKRRGVTEQDELERTISEKLKAGESV